MFYACFTLIGSWEGRNNFRVGIFLNKHLLGWGYRKQTTFLGLSPGAGYDLCLGHGVGQVSGECLFDKSIQSCLFQHA